MWEKFEGAVVVPDGLLKLLGQKYSLRILTASSKRPVSARELVDEFDVPKTTVYRRLQCLEEQDLVTVEGRVDADGAHDTVYRCNLDELRVAVEDDQPRCEILFRDEPQDRWAYTWRKMNDPDD